MRDISRRQWFRGTALGAAGLAGISPGGLALTLKRPRNLLFLMTDQHNADTMSCLGDPHAITPTLDGLAASGTSFSQAYCQDPVCVPSRASILTGRYVRSIGTLGNGYATNRELISFPQLLRSKGYKSACFGKLHLVGRNDLDWDELKEKTDLKPKIPPGSVMVPGILNGTKPVGAPAPYGEEATNEWDAKERSIEFMKKHRDKPWVIQCSMHKPHPPWQPPKKYWDKINRDNFDIPVYPKDDLDDVNPRVSNLLNTRKLHNLPEEKIRDAIQGYYGNVAFCDAMFAQVLKALDELGLREDTVIIYTADHGEMLYAHGLWTKFNFFDESVRVPLIISYPGTVKAGVRSDALVELVDLFPTFMDLLGFETPPEVQGRSLMPVLTGKSAKHRDYVRSEFYYPVQKKAMRMHFDGRFKFIDNDDEAPPELYDQKNDPREITNIADTDEHREHVKSICKELRTWAKQDTMTSLTRRELNQKKKKA